MEKITFKNWEKWPECDSESLFAKKISKELYEIRNVPLYLYGLNWGDQVKVAYENSQLIGKEVIKYGGHSTYRIFFHVDPDEQNGIQLLNRLNQIGCTYERANNSLFGIDVPPDSNIHIVYAFLKEGEQLNYWEFEEGHCGHPL